MGFGGPASMVWQQEQLVADAARRAKQQGMPAAQHPLRPPLAQAAAQQAQHAAQRQQQAQAAQAQPSAAPVAGQPQVPPDATQPLLFSQPLGQQVANLGQRSPPWYQQGWGQQQPQQQQAAPPPLPPRQPPPPQPQEPALPRSSHGSLWSGSKAGAQRVRGNPFVSESEEAVGGGGPGVTCAPPGAAHAAVGVGSSRPAGKLPPPPRFLLVSRGGPSQAVQQQAHVQHRHAEQPHSQPQEPQQQQPHITGQQQQTQQRAASPALPSSAHEPAVQPGLPPPQPPAPMVMAAAGSSQVAQPPPPPPPPLRPAVGGGTAVPPPPPPPPPPLSPPCRSAPTAVRGALAPAPPAQLATAHVHASCTASSAPAVVDAGSCGLSDIKPSELAAAAARLRRVDAATAGGGREPGPGTTAATAGDFRAQLMAAIQGRRFQLRPVEKQQQRPSVQGACGRVAVAQPGACGSSEARQGNMPKRGVVVVLMAHFGTGVATTHEQQQRGFALAPPAVGVMWRAWLRAAEGGAAWTWVSECQRGPGILDTTDLDTADLDTTSPVHLPQAVLRALTAWLSCCGEWWNGGAWPAATAATATASGRAERHLVM